MEAEMLGTIFLGPIFAEPRDLSINPHWDWYDSVTPASPYPTKTPCHKVQTINSFDGVSLPPDAKTGDE